MDRYTFIKNDFRKLLTGFRFHPTDEELVVHYLKPKAFSRRLPVSFIHEVDVCKSNPWDLPGDKKQEMYFFSIKEAKYPSGNRTNRATSRGYWKATGKDKKIGTLRSNQVVGMKKTLVFYHGRAPNGSRTDWIMHEYRLSEPCNDSQESKTSKAKNSSVPMENWVLCRVFLKKRGSKSEDDNKISCDDNVEKISGMKMPILHDFISHESFDLNVAPSSSSSGSSGVTVVSSNVSDDHEESSSCKIVPCLQKRP